MNDRYYTMIQQPIKLARLFHYRDITTDIVALKENWVNSLSNNYFLNNTGLLKSTLNSLREDKELLKLSNFLFSHTGFYPS